MALVKTFVSKVETPWGDVYPQAVIGIMNVTVMNKSSSIADNINGEVTVTNGDIVGGTFTASFFNSAQTQAQGKPDRPVEQMEDGRLTEVFTIDMEDVQVKQILAGPQNDQDKRDNIARVQFIKHFA